MLIAIDFETHLISKESPIPKPICLSYYDGKQEGLVTSSKMERTLELLFKSEHTLIAHNMSFELGVIDQYYPALRRYIDKKLERKELICTKIYEQLIDCIRKKSIMQFNLAALVLAYFETDISGDKKDPLAWRLRYSELEDIDLKEWPSEAVRYAIEDSIWAYKVYQEQLKVPLDISNSVAADFYLNKMGLAGTNIDRERVLLLESELKSAVKEHTEILLDAQILTKNKKGVTKRNMILLKSMLIEALPDTIRKTAKGSISTSNEDMEQYLLDLPSDSPLRPILVSYVEAMRVEKVLTAFIFRLKQAEPLIRT